MFEREEMSICQNNANISTKTNFTNISSYKEKNTSFFSKKINLDHREFGNDITNIALTVFENNTLISNKSILKAIELIKASKKNKERSREKSLTKNKNQMFSKNCKINKKSSKKRPNQRITCEMAVERKKTNVETCNIAENEQIINISEFNIGNNNNMNNTCLFKKENEFLSKITEINIKIDKDNVPLSHHLHKNEIKNESISNKFDLQYVKEYQEEIIEYLLSLEHEKRINPNYMKQQKDINEKMRIILIDWLIEVHLKFKLLPETLFLTINFIDRYLQKNQTKRDKLQLIAVSSLLIACKYEEIYPPEISSFVYITDNAYKKEEILEYELKILESLDYDITYPTPLRFLEILIVKVGLINDNFFYYKMQYLLELSLSKLCFYNYTYLELVLSCCLFLFENDFNMTQNILLCFDLCDKKEKLKKIKDCICDIKTLLEYANMNKTSFKGIKQKFSMEKYGSISRSKLL